MTCLPYTISQEELEQWVEAAKQKEEDNLALQKYTRADEAKIKELALSLEKVTSAVVTKRTDVENEVSRKLRVQYISIIITWRERQPHATTLHASCFLGDQYQGQADGIGSYS